MELLQRSVCYYYSVYLCKGVTEPVSGEPKYTSDAYPDDLDTTSLGLLTMPPDSEIVHSILDEMLDYIDEDGNVQVRCQRPSSQTTVVKLT